MKKKYKVAALIICIVCLTLVIASNFKSTNTKIQDAQYNTFEEDINKNVVSKVYMPDSPYIYFQLKNGSVYKTENPRSLNFKENLLKKGVIVSETDYMYTINVAPKVLIFISLIAIAVFFIRKKSKDSQKIFSKDSLVVSPVTERNFTFENVAGNEEAKESLNDIIEFLKDPEKFYSYGARMPKGVILYGEPGTGKTLLAKAVAGEANVPFYAMSGSDFVQIYVGVGASRIRQLFKKAKGNKKAVIFIDEIDAIGKKRDGSSSGGSDERDQTLNALLTEMSGFNEEEGVIVMAATNRLDMLDSALLRPGRFDRHIEVALPDLNARKKILELHLKNKPVSNINIESIAKKTTYFSGAKIESLTNEAAILAIKEGSPFIEEKHLDEAYSITLAGHEKKDRSYIKDKDREITAFHEAGHALLSLRLIPEDKVSKVTIIPSTKGAGGYTMSIPEDSMYMTKDYITKKIMVLLGGRAAEDIIFTNEFITTGASNDLKEGTRLSFNMITQYGMGNSIGLLSSLGLPEIDSNTTNKISTECTNLLDSLYTQAKDILMLNKDILTKIAEELLKNETILEDKLIEITEQ
ncbi:MAG: AAA family ATPase [Clostridium sp.]|nr:AAA family ATPase [Clostridium sp.]